MKQQTKKNLKTFAWLVSGLLMASVTYTEYQSWLETGIVAVRREGIRMTGNGAIAVLAAYSGMAIVFFALAYSTWRGR